MSEQQQWQALGEWLVGDGPDPRPKETTMTHHEAHRKDLEKLFADRPTLMELW